MKPYASDLSDAEWAIASAVDSSSQTRRPTEKRQYAADPQWNLLYAAQWRSLASAAP
jgi:hypothetical protein